MGQISCPLAQRCELSIRKWSVCTALHTRHFSLCDMRPSQWGSWIRIVAAVRVSLLRLTALAALHSYAVVPTMLLGQVLLLHGVPGTTKPPFLRHWALSQSSSDDVQSPMLAAQAGRCWASCMGRLRRTYSSRILAAPLHPTQPHCRIWMAHAGW